MFAKDDRGYVLSGMGLLLLIPVMIIIPTFLAVESQSSNIPNSMVSSDTSYRIFNDVKADIRNQIFSFGDKIQNKTFLISDSSTISSSINTLCNNVNNNRYQSVFHENIYLTPIYSQNRSTWDYTKGNISFSNGLAINYYNNTGFYNLSDGTILCNYTMAVQTNMIINVNEVNGNNGHNQQYFETYRYSFTVNSGQKTNATAITEIDKFFNNILGSINYT